MATRKTVSSATKRKPTIAQVAARKLFAERARSGELRKEKTHHAASLARRKTARAAPVNRAKNPAKSTPVKTVRKQSLVGGVHYAVLAYQGRTRPTGKPDIVFPARDVSHARSFARELESRGFSGVVLIEKTVAGV